MQLLMGAWSLCGDAVDRLVARVRAFMSVLECTGIGQLTLVDFTWRLDYHVRSSATGIEHVPVYFVSMKTKAPNGEYGQKDFTLSHEQMQDMLATARDAIKAVERLKAGVTE